jgi:Flp pilus assembly protein TadG
MSSGVENGPFRPCSHCVDPRLGVSLGHPNILREAVFRPVNLSESVENLLRKIQMFAERRGEGLVEFALILPMFLLLMFALIDLGRYYWIRETVENAVRQAGRYAVTGQTLASTNRVASIQQVAQNAMAGLYNPNTTTITVNSSPVLKSGNTTTNFAGYGGENVTVTITTALGFFTPGIARYFGPSGSNTLTESVTFRNESFPVGQAN